MVTAVKGNRLVTGDRVRWCPCPHTGTWTVLPPIPDDPVRWLGRRDGALIPIVPDEDYELAS